MTASEAPSPIPSTPGPDDLLEVGVWWALETHHAHLARREGAARAYRADVAGFASFDPSITELDEGAWDDLGRLIREGGTAFLSSGGVPAEPPAGWATLASALGRQMVLTEPDRLHVDAPGASRSPAAIRELTDVDVPAMMALVAATDPGPFFERTIEMGRYIGVFDDGRLVAMAGERIHPPGFTEISAVCTHPDARGRGHGTALVRAVADGIIGRGETPFLNVRVGNQAQSLYEQLGFHVRRTYTFRAVRFG